MDTRTLIIKAKNNSGQLFKAKDNWTAFLILVDYGMYLVYLSCKSVTYYGNTKRSRPLLLLVSHFINSLF